MGKIAVGVCLGLFLTAAVGVGIAVVGSASTGDSQAKEREARADDRTARSQALNLVSSVEACFVETLDYAACDEGELGDHYPNPRELGSGEGQVELASTGGPGSYTVVAHSKSGNSFRVERQRYNFRRFCTTAGEATCPPSGRW